MNKQVNKAINSILNIREATRILKDDGVNFDRIRYAYRLSCYGSPDFFLVWVEVNGGDKFYMIDADSVLLIGEAEFNNELDWHVYGIES